MKGDFAMAFSLDRSLSYVRIDEPNLISIHRSAKSAGPNDDVFFGHLCEAFILAARENNTCRVYAAIYDTQLKSNFIYVPDQATGKNVDGDALVCEAEAFLKNMGFSVEPVNIRFSPAVREVVIRDIKVMRPPKVAVVKPIAEPSVPTRQKDKPHVPSVSPAKVQIFETEESKGPEQDSNQNNGATVFERALSGDESTRDAALELESLKSDLAVAKQELDAERAARRAVEDKMALALEKGSADFAALKMDRDRLKSQLASLREKSDLRYRTQATAMSELESENAGLRDDLARLRSMQDNTAAELAEEVKTLRDALRKTESELDAERSKNEQLSDSVQTTSREVETVRAALNNADESLRVERSKNDSALREMEALEQNAAAQLKSLNQKVESLHAEKRLLESIAAEMKLKASGEIERLQKLNQSQRKAAIQKISELKEEMRQLAEARAVISSSFAVPQKLEEGQDPITGVSKQDMPMQPLDVACSNSYTSPDPFGCPACVDEVCFEPDMTLMGVPYAEVGNVMEVHRSFNKIHAAPAGRLVQTCEGFVCLVNDGGEETVFAVWLMNKTDEVLVCRPNITRDSGYTSRQLLQEGINYFERVGFMMDSLHLEADLDLRQEQLDALSIFKKVDLVCAA